MTIKERIALTAELDARYAATLEGPRPRNRGGSYTDKALTAYDDVEFLPAEDQSLAGPGTQILRGHCVGINGICRIATLEMCAERGYPVHFREGAHGWEPYIMALWDGYETDWVTLVVATDNNPDGLKSGALVTWYPGEATAQINMKAGVKYADL